MTTFVQSLEDRIDFPPGEIQKPAYSYHYLFWFTHSRHFAGVNLIKLK